MKYKNFLLVTFFLTLFVFQQVQAGATIPQENLSQVSFAPPHAPLSTINVFVLALKDDGTNTIDLSITGQPYMCLYSYQYHGCGIIDPTDPANPQNPASIPVDLYLQDVLTVEMDIAGIPPADEAFQAFKAQAVAARTFASWKAVNQGYIYPPDNTGGYTYINNSTQYQVFIPGSYNNSQVANKSLIINAISETQGQYLSYFPDEYAGDNTRKTIDAEFGSEAGSQTEPELGKGYMVTVQEPNFSSGCGVTRNYAGRGMSQRGAMRWARGTTCPNGTGANWSVTWTDYRQILAHYYTGIDILNGSGVKVAPDDRWNLLSHTIAANTQVNAGTMLPISVTLQNTSTTNWAVNDIILGYQWTAVNAAPVAGNWMQSAYLPATNMGNPPTTLTNPPIQAPTVNGTYTLHLDLQRSGNNTWFSSAGWPDAQIPVTVVGVPTATPTVPPAATPTGIYNNSRLNEVPVLCDSEYVDGSHPQTCVVSGSCVWDDTLKKLTCSGTWTAQDTYVWKTQWIHPLVILTGTNMSSGMSIWWRNAISSTGNANSFNYCVDGTGDFGRTGSRQWGNGPLCFRQSTGKNPIGWFGPLSGSFNFEFGLYPTYLTPTPTPTATFTPTATATNTSTPVP